MNAAAVTPGRRLAPLTGLSEAQRDRALARWQLLRPHVEDGVALTRLAAERGVPLRTLQRWQAGYRAGGLAGLAPAARPGRGERKMPPDLVALIEGLALRRSAPTIAAVHRQASGVAARRGWPSPSYGTVYAIVRDMDPALVMLAQQPERYREVFDLVYRRDADAPNEIWQADHTELDLWVVTPAGTPARPWLTVIEDDYSRAIAGYAVNLGAPSALQTALVLRQAIWRKAEPGWQVCGIPGVFYTDHGSDFTSRHMEQAAADMGMRLVFSLPGQPRGRGKVERYLDTINQMCLAALPGYAPRGTKDRAGQARLSLAELDAALGAFIVTVYNHRVHSETHQPPQACWEAGGFLPCLPESLEQLDLLLLTVAKPRKVHPDGIRFQGLRYLDPVLADYVGESVIIRYGPRDLAEIRVFHRGRFLGRAICPDLAAATVSLKEITAARSARRRELRRQIGERASVVDRLIAVHTPPPASPPAGATQAEDQPAPGLKLKRYREE